MASTLKISQWEWRGKFLYSQAGFWLCVHKNGDIEIQHESSDTHAILSPRILSRMIFNKTGDKRWEEVPMTETVDPVVMKTAEDFVTAMSKRNEEPADRVASHRILHLSCAQFDAFIALTRAVEAKNICVEDRAGVKMLIALQKVLGNVEPPETALSKWRKMPASQKDEVWKMYKLIDKT